jgi:hypothetical protein
MCGAQAHVRYTPESDRNSNIVLSDEGQSISARPLQGSNVDLLRYCKDIIHIDAEIDRNHWQ